nr:unnamed protein product [Callosobruchus analis]
MMNLSSALFKKYLMVS